MAIDPQIRSQGLYFLKRNPLFSALGEDILAELVKALKPLNLEKGAVLLREGEAADALYLIKSGRVRILSKTDKGEESAVAYLSRGDAVGELSVLTGEAQAFTAVLDIACEFLIISKTDFDALLETHPLVGVHLSRALSHRLAVSFHPHQGKLKEPLLATLVPALPHEALVLSTINLAISLAEQTRRRVLLLDVSPRSGDMARALGLHPAPLTEKALQEEDLQDIAVLHRWITSHPSGLEILSIDPHLLEPHYLSIVPSLLSILKDSYDFTLALAPTERSPLAEVVLRESDKAFLISWDQAADLAASTSALLKENLGASPVPVLTVTLHHPSTPGNSVVDFRVPWMESFHQPFREKGTPYLSARQAGSALSALDRIARALGRLRVGVAMGSGAAYGYALIGLLKIFEREGIPIDMVAGASMGALLGSFFCSGLSPTHMQEIAKTITKRWLFENILGDITFPRSGFLAGQTLSAFLREHLGNIEFHQMPIPFAAVATDIRSGHEVVLREGRVVDAVRASTSLPILFQPVLHKGRFLVDGGLINPVPTSTVAEMGADILISVNLTAKPSVRRGLGRYRHAFPLAPKSPAMTEVFFKMIYTMQYEIAQARTEIAHVVIAPETRDFLWTDFHRSEEILKVGEAAGEEAVTKIKNLLPYFSDYCRVPLGISLRAY